MTGLSSFVPLFLCGPSSFVRRHRDLTHVALDPGTARPPYTPTKFRPACRADRAIHMKTGVTDRPADQSATGTVIFPVGTLP